MYSMYIEARKREMLMMPIPKYTKYEAVPPSIHCESAHHTGRNKWRIFARTETTTRNGNDTCFLLPDASLTFQTREGLTGVSNTIRSIKGRDYHRLETSGCCICSAGSNKLS